MSKRSFVGMMAAAAMAAVGLDHEQFAKPTPSGNMNLGLQEYEIIGGIDQVNILGIGQEIVDTGGNFAGDETSTYLA
jgi:hypothetical protein